MTLTKSIKKELLEKFAITYNNDGFPPLAGKIIGLFYLLDKKHLSFEEIMDEIETSKGGTSKALKLLLDKKIINFIYSKEKWKKRLFYLDPNGMIAYLDSAIENLAQQNQLFKKSLSFRSENGNKDMNIFISKSIQFNDEVSNFLITKSNQYFKS